MAKQRAKLEPIRELEYDQISGSYAAVGTPFDNPCRLICFSNNTEGDMYFSTDGVNNYLFVASGSFKLFDVSTNHRPSNQSDFVFEKGTQWYVKQISAPVSGFVYIETLYTE
jgi:hypothetical protein